MNSEFDDQGQFGKPDLSTSIFKKTTFAFEDSKTIGYRLKSQRFNSKYEHAFKSNFVHFDISLLFCLPMRT